MPTRPSQGGSSGTWGTELNAWLDANIPYIDSRNYLVGDDTTDDTTNFATWLAACVASKLPGFFAGGSSGTTCKITATLDWSGYDSLSIIGIGAKHVTISQHTANTPILKLGGDGSTTAYNMIGGFGLTFHSAPSSSDTNAIAIQLGGFIFSKLWDIDIDTTGWGIRSIPGSSGAICFSSFFENLAVRNCSVGGILLDSDNDTDISSSGNVWNSVYLYNGNTSIANSALKMTGFVDGVINQLNVENFAFGSTWGLNFSVGGALTVNSLHMEGNAFNFDGRGGIIVGNNTELTINGMTSGDNTWASGTSKALFYVADSSKLDLSGFHRPNPETVTVTAHPFVSFSSATSADVWLRNIADNALSDFTQPYVSGTSAAARCREFNAPCKPENPQTGTTYTLAVTDRGCVVSMNNGSANTLTVPPASSVPWVVGDTVDLFQKGAGQTTVAAGLGVTIRAPSTKGLKLATQYAAATLRYQGSDVWALDGDTSA